MLGAKRVFCFCFMFLQLVNFYRRFSVLFCFELYLHFARIYTFFCFVWAFAVCHFTCIYIRRRFATLEIKTEHIQMFPRENEPGLGFLRFACFWFATRKIKTHVSCFCFCFACVGVKRNVKNVSSREYSLVPSEQCLSTLSKFVDFRKKCFLGIAVEFACLLVY